jgi:hypothetical protein
MRQRREAALTMASFWELSGDKKNNNNINHQEGMGVTSPPLGSRPAPLPPPGPASSQDQKYSPQDHRFTFSSQQQQGLQHYSSCQHLHSNKQQKDMYSQQQQDYPYQQQRQRQAQHYEFGSGGGVSEMDYESEHLQQNRLHQQQGGQLYQEQDRETTGRRSSRSEYSDDDRAAPARYRDMQ